jgi:hypothetical protein
LPNIKRWALIFSLDPLTDVDGDGITTLSLIRMIDQED